MSLFFNVPQPKEGEEIKGIWSYLSFLQKELVRGLNYLRVHKHTGGLNDAEKINVTSVTNGQTSALTSAHILVGNAGNTAADVAMSGDVGIDNAGATTIGVEKVTYAKMQHISATARVLGRNSAGAGDVEEVTPAQVAAMFASGDIAVAKVAGGSDGSASGYFKLGNMMIQWGTTGSVTTDTLGVSPIYFKDTSAVTFPVVFKTGSTPIVTCNCGTGSAGGCWGQGAGVTNTGFQPRLLGWSNHEVSTIQWIAIGLIA